MEKRKKGIIREGICKKKKRGGRFTCGVVSTRALVRVIPKEESIYFTTESISRTNSPSLVFFIFRAAAQGNPSLTIMIKDDGELPQWAKIQKKVRDASDSQRENTTNSHKYRRSPTGSMCTWLTDR